MGRLTSKEEGAAHERHARRGCWKPVRLPSRMAATVVHRSSPSCAGRGSRPCPVSCGHRTGPS